VRGGFLVIDDIALKVQRRQTRLGAVVAGNADVADLEQDVVGEGALVDLLQRVGLEGVPPRGLLVGSLRRRRRGAEGVEGDFSEGLLARGESTGWTPAPREFSQATAWWRLCRNGAGCRHFRANFCATRDRGQAHLSPTSEVTGGQPEGLAGDSNRTLP